MKNIHPEFAYQSRELGIQIEDTLGDPPDRKNYANVVKSLLGEYAKAVVEAWHKADKIFDVYPNAINYMGRFDFGDLDTKIALMPLQGTEDAYAQDVEKFKAIFPVLQDKEIGKDSFY